MMSEKYMITSKILMHKIIYENMLSENNVKYIRVFYIFLYIFLFLFRAVKLSTVNIFSQIYNIFNLG